MNKAVLIHKKQKVVVWEVVPNNSGFDVSYSEVSENGEIGYYNREYVNNYYASFKGTPEVITITWKFAYNNI